MTAPVAQDISALGAPRWRLVVAAVACALSLGVGWSGSYRSTPHFNPGLTLPTTYYGADGYMYTSYYYLPGSLDVGDPYRATPGARSEERVVLVPLVAALGWAAVDRSGRARRVVLPAAAALVLLAVVAASRGMSGAAITVVVALAALAPEVRTIATSRYGWVISSGDHR